MLRRATADDVPALVELRGVMFAGLGHLDARGDELPGWRDAAARWFLEHLGADACAYVVDVDGRPVAMALGYVHTAPPAPSDPHPVRGQVANVVTLPAHRRRGHARACVEALIGWFREATTAGRVDLVASADGLALYESLGWVRRDDPTLRLRLQRTTRGRDRRRPKIDTQRRPCLITV